MVKKEIKDSNIKNSKNQKILKNKTNVDQKSKTKIKKSNIDNVVKNDYASNKNNNKKIMNETAKQKLNKYFTNKIRIKYILIFLLLSGLTISSSILTYIYNNEYNQYKNLNAIFDIYKSNSDLLNKEIDYINKQVNNQEDLNKLLNIYNESNSILYLLNNLYSKNDISKTWNQNVDNELTYNLFKLINNNEYYDLIYPLYIKSNKDLFIEYIYVIKLKEFNCINKDYYFWITIAILTLTIILLILYITYLIYKINRLK